MTSGICLFGAGESMVRLSAEMMPLVIVRLRPNGLPMAKTFWPTCRSCEVPSSIGLIASLGRLGVRRELENGEVVFRRVADEDGLVSVAVGHHDADRRVRPALDVGDDVVVGDDPPVIVPDEPGPGAGLLFERAVRPSRLAGPARCPR